MLPQIKNTRLHKYRIFIWTWGYNKEDKTCNVFALTISFNSFNVISEETLNSWEPFKFLRVLDGLVVSILGLFAATYNETGKIKPVNQ